MRSLIHQYHISGNTSIWWLYWIGSLKQINRVVWIYWRAEFQWIIWFLCIYRRHLFAWMDEAPECCARYAQICQLNHYLSDCLVILAQFINFCFLCPMMNGAVMFELAIRPSQQLFINQIAIISPLYNLCRTYNANFNWVLLVLMANASRTALRPMRYTPIGYRLQAIQYVLCVLVCVEPNEILMFIDRIL